MHTTFTGERVRLRPFASGEEVFHLCCKVNANTNPYWGQIWFPKVMEMRAFKPDGFMNPEDVCIFAIDRIDTSELVGFEVAMPRRFGQLVGEVGTFIDPDHQKMGFGVEAKQLCMRFMFDHFPVNQVFGITIENHAPARRGLELCGMKYFGSKRNVCLSKGKWRDVVYHRMWREDFEQHPINEIVKRGN